MYQNKLKSISNLEKQRVRISLICIKYDETISYLIFFKN